MYQSLTLPMTEKPELCMMYYESRMNTRGVMPCLGTCSTSIIASKHRQDVHVCRKLTNEAQAHRCAHYGTISTISGMLLSITTQDML